MRTNRRALIGSLGALSLSACAAAPATMNIGKSSLKLGDLFTLGAQGRQARISLMGFTHATALENGTCTDPNIETYAIVGSVDKDPMIEEPETRLYSRHMTAAQIKASSNVRCRPTYSQVYQPPLKLGGSGRVIQVPNGEKCEVVG